jgi:hypothetical protein
MNAIPSVLMSFTPAPSVLLPRMGRTIRAGCDEVQPFPPDVRKAEYQSIVKVCRPFGQVTAGAYQLLREIVGER